MIFLDVDDFLKENEIKHGNRVPWDGMTVDDFLTHLVYECDSCLGNRQLSDTCTGIRTNTCTGNTCTICPPKPKKAKVCQNDCDFRWSKTTTSPTTGMSTTTKTATATTTEATTDKTTKPTSPGLPNSSYVPLLNAIIIQQFLVFPKITLYTR